MNLSAIQQRFAHRRAKEAESRHIKHWGNSADNLSKAGWSWSCVSPIDSNGFDRQSARERFRVDACPGAWLDSEKPRVEATYMPRIAWIEDKDATGQLAQCYDTLKAMNPFGDGEVPDVFRAMSQRPEFLAGVLGILPVQFSDGHLTRAQHEMIASYVSVLNRCHF
jgi:hypothetical protein